MEVSVAGEVVGRGIGRRKALAEAAAGFALRQPFFFGLNNIIGPLVAGEDLRPEFGPPIMPDPTAADDGIPPARVIEDTADHSAAARPEPARAPLPLG